MGASMMKQSEIETIEYQWAKDDLEDGRPIKRCTINGSRLMIETADGDIYSVHLDSIVRRPK